MKCSQMNYNSFGSFLFLYINKEISMKDITKYITEHKYCSMNDVKGAIKDTIATMNNFGMNFTEGMTGEESEVGAYGPYKQSLRKEIYKTFAKDLVKKGLAYPCFCTPEELNAVRDKQMAEKVTPGYHGEYAVCRNISPEDVYDVTVFIPELKIQRKIRV